MIEPVYFWTNIALLALGTIAIRFSFIAFSKRFKITPRQKELFTFIPAAILPALTLPMAFFHQGRVEWMFGKERLVILLAATVVCFLSRSMVFTVGFGMVSLYFVTQVFV